MRPSASSPRPPDLPSGNPGGSRVTRTEESGSTRRESLRSRARGSHMSAEETALLIVEDDPNALLLLKRAFRKVGLQAPLHEVMDGDEAVAYLSGKGSYADRRLHPMPCMILLNLKLPK